MASASRRFVRRSFGRTTALFFALLLLASLRPSMVVAQEDVQLRQDVLPLPVDEVPILPPLTPEPSLEPTLAPVTAKPTSLAPTSLPPDVVDVVDVPVVAPSGSPTGSPTDPPTNPPTRLPTLTPSFRPSVSHGPSNPPSLVPSTSAWPTHQPSLRPSRTQPPTAMPSESTAPTSDTIYTGLTMTLSGISYIDDVSDWESLTARYYEAVYNGKSNSDLIDGAVVEITLTNQNTKMRRNRTRRLAGRRMQQQQQQSVDVTYTQTTTYRRIDSDISVNEMLELPLSTQEYRDWYAETLKGNLEGYEGLTSVSSITSPYGDGEGGDKAIDGTEDAGGWTSGMIIGVACGAAALVILLVAFVVYRRMGTDDNDKKEDLEKDLAKGEGGDGKSEDAVDTSAATRVLLAGSSSRPKPTLDDRSVASNEPYLGDALDVAEELLTVYAPAGKLGIVIDSPDSGAPVVHGLKDTSPIADKVRAGDRLVAVDDEDVRAMTAIKVSKLISRKGGSSRKLTVVRHVG